MKCRRCGAVMPKGALRCAKCGTDIRIVPDYNPLDDVLAAQVKGSIDGSEAPLDDYDYEEVERRTNYINREAVAKKSAAADARRRDTAARRNTSGGVRRTSGSTGKRPMTPEQKKRQAERKRALKKKKRLRALIILGMLAVVILVLGLILYQFSYKGQVNKGYKSLQKKEYSDAEAYFQRAVNRKPRRKEAYEGLIELYLAQNDADKAETMMLDAVDQYPNSTDVYEACFSFYIATKKQGEIPLLLDEARVDVAGKLSDYVSESPNFSLKDDEPFEDVQQLSLESPEEKIYYTTDGSDPFYSDTRTEYKEPIQISEGENVIKAVSVNKKEIPSLTVTKTYTVELPIEDAPAVSPSTGQYEEAKEITIVVPDGYTAYYTMDDSEPTESSELYTGPVTMPEGSTIFKAVLINGNGKPSGITTRNYELTLN